MPSDDVMQAQSATPENTDHIDAQIEVERSQYDFLSRKYIYHTLPTSREAFGQRIYSVPAVKAISFAEILKFPAIF